LGISIFAIYPYGKLLKPSSLSWAQCCLWSWDKVFWGEPDIAARWHHLVIDCSVMRICPCKLMSAIYCIAWSFFSLP